MGKVMLKDLILDEDVRETCDEFLEEQRSYFLLHKHNCPPRHKILITGATGNGKTLLAKALVNELSLPLYQGAEDSGRASVRVFDNLEALCESDLSDNLEALCESDLSDVHPHKVVIATADSSYYLSDRILRRFDIKIGLRSPGNSQIQERIDRFLTVLGYTLRADLRGKLVEDLRSMRATYARVEETLMTIRRRHILSIRRHILSNLSNPTWRFSEQSNSLDDAVRRYFGW